MIANIVLGIHAVVLFGYCAYRGATANFFLDDAAAAPAASDGSGKGLGTLSLPVVIAFPVIASLMLLLLFFAPSLATLVLLIDVMVSATIALVLIGSHMVQCICPSSALARSRVIAVILVVAAVCLLVLWMGTDSWIFANIIAISLAAFVSRSVRSPSLRITLVLLVGMFCYDIFWVFLSRPVFGTNVMVQSAQTDAPNLVDTVSRAIGFSFILPQELSLPIKLSVPQWPDNGMLVLGLGDVVLPAIAFSFVLRLDRKRGTPWTRSYLLACTASYAAALVLCDLALMRYNVAQPALLYIVPVMTLGVVIHARLRGELGEVWRGSFEGPAASGAASASTASVLPVVAPAKAASKIE